MTIMSSSRTSTRLSSVVLALTLFAAGPSLACRCNEPDDAAAYRDADAVVRATVIRVSGNPVGPGGAVALLEVHEAWKAAVGDPLEVETSTTCGYMFETGKDYLVYLRAGSASAPYTTRKCMGNQALLDAQERLRWLHRNGEPAVGASAAAGR
jgi:hypothetical protein